MFEPVDTKVSFPALEQDILRFWREHDVPRRAIDKPGPRGEYVFFEGPPTANGRPGIHHVSARAFKDLYPRYKTMRGYHCGRRGGWDTHGLPVEVEIEKQIGSTGKRDIENYGIARFNERCRDSVFKYIQDWNGLTERIAFWLDLDNAYVTYHNGYIESCWWILKSLWERGLLFEDYKVTMHCPRCNSTLADHEVSLGMREDVDDPSVWPKFPAHAAGLVAAGILDAGETRRAHFLAWTTTPWTLPANTALAVRADATYALVEARRHHGEGEPVELYLLAEARVAGTFGDEPHRVLKTFPGQALVGVTYDKLLEGHVPADEDLSGGWRVIADDFVSLDDGTGIVHIAPAYGDLAIGQKYGLPTLFSVDLEGRVFPEVRLAQPLAGAHAYAGLFFKDADKPLWRDLTHAGLMYRVARIKHAYPMCWRDDSPLLFYAKSSWYIRTTALRERLLDANARVNWVPEHVKTGRFGRWLENNIDWAITRERYWGCPFPMWRSDDGERLCVGSVEELARLSGRDLKDLDLHRPFVDEITLEKDGKTFRRLPYTIDVWFESGAMPYAQWHYPFENKAAFESQFPADFICEGMDQTRGWFYSLHALATLLTDSGDPATGRAPGPLAHLTPDSPAFRNCVVLGLINDAQGRKMSKTRGNTVDPWNVIEEHGADALRWYLYSGGQPGENKNFDRASVVEVLRNFFLTLWNTYGFFVLYARIDAPDLVHPLPAERLAEADRWLLSKLQVLVRQATVLMDAYNVTAATRAIEAFVVDDLSNWYVRNNRRRYWKSAGDDDKLAAYQTLYRALETVARLIAPMAPFVAEALYQNLRRQVDPDAPTSVHLASWPEPDEAIVDHALLADMDLVLRLIDLGRAARAEAKIKTRQPLRELIVRVTSARELGVVRRLEELLLRELNVKGLRLLELGSDFVSYSVRPHPRVCGKLLGKDFPAFKAQLDATDARPVADNVHRGLATTFEVAGRQVSFPPEAFFVDVRGPEGYVAQESGGYMVALSTEITQDLIEEGWVRELTRLVQNARKNAGFDVADRIRLALPVSERLRAVLAVHGAYLRQEALVADLGHEPLTDAEHREEFELEGERFEATLRRA
jgi:isoleucyl-tRNA synthetase